jgi:ABC-type transport system involved in cytochrome c biogenesis permease subunit
MGVIIVGGVLFGTLLGRFFKIFILVPASALAIVLVLVSPTSAETSWWQSLLEIIVLITSLQVGYFVGLVTGSSLLEDARGTWSQGDNVPRSYRVP